MAGFMLGGMPDNSPDKPNPFDLAEKLGNEARAKEQAIEVEEAKTKQLADKKANMAIPNTNPVAPEVGAKGLTAEEATQAVKLEKDKELIEMARFEQNQDIEMTTDVQLQAAMAGKNKGLTVEQTEQKLRSKGYQVPAGMVRDTILAKGLELGKLDKVADKYGIPTDNASYWKQFGQELLLIGNEALAGQASLTNESEQVAGYKANAKILRDKEIAWKNQNSSLNDDGTLNRPLNISGGLAEVGAYGLIGAATGGISTLPNVAMKTAALADFVVASTLDTARAIGDTEQTKEGYAFNIAANVLGFGMARYIPSDKSVNKLIPEEVKALNNATIEQKAFAVEYNKWLEDNKVKLSESDVSDFDTTINMFISEAQKNFTTASVVADSLKGNMENLTKATFKMMGNMPNAKEVTPSMSNNIKQALLNVETDLDNKMGQAFTELDKLDPKTARIPGDVLLDDYKFSDSYKAMAADAEGKEAIKYAEQSAIDFDTVYTPSSIYNLNKRIKDRAYDPSLSRTQRKAYVKLSTYLDDRMSQLAKLQDSEPFIEKLEFAKGLAKDKGRIFGFDDAGKNADISNIPKLIAEGNPDKVMALLLSDPYTFEAINKLLPAQTKGELQDFVKGSLLQNNTIKGKIGTASIIDFKGLAKDIDKMDTRTLTKLFGDEEALNMKFLSTVAKTLGAQANTVLAGGNVLGAMAEKGRISTAASGGPSSWASYLLGLMTSRASVTALMAKDRAALRFKIRGLTKELEEAGIKDNKGIITQVINNIDELPALPKTPRPKEYFGEVTGVNIASPTQTAETIKQADRDTKAKFSQVSQDFSKVNQAITAKNRVGKMDRETRDIYNRLREAYQDAKYRGDTDTMSKVTEQLDRLYNEKLRGFTDGGMSKTTNETSAIGQIKSIASGGLKLQGSK